MPLNQPLKILQVASHFNLTRGGAVQMVRLALGLARRGHHVECVVHRPADNPLPGGERFRPLASAGIHVHSYNMERWSEVLRFRRWLLTEHFDVIHSHRDRALRFAYLATIGLPRSHAFVTNRGTENPVPRWTLARLAFRSRRMDRVIAVCEAVKQALVRNEGLRPEKISVVYGSVDPERFHPGVSGARIRHELGLGAETPLVGMVAALVHKKGHRDFAAMIPRVLERIPQARFLWVGKGKRGQFEKYTADLKQRDTLVYLGHREDIPEILAALDVVVCASTRGEGLTGTLREALAMARPVVTTDVAGNTELVKHGVTGLVTPPRRPDLLADAVVLLLVDPTRAREMAQAGHRLVYERFLDAHRSEAIESIYYEILGQRLAAGERQRR